MPPRQGVSQSTYWGIMLKTTIAILMIVVSIPSLAIAKTSAEEYKPHTCHEVSDPIKSYACWQTSKIFGEDQWKYIDDLVSRESKWKCDAQNPSSTAFGLFQFLNSAWGLVDSKKTTDCKKQIDYGMEYVKKTYKTPKNAITFHNKNNWY